MLLNRAFVAHVAGNSMYPILQASDWILVKRVSNPITSKCLKLEATSGTSSSTETNAVTGAQLSAGKIPNAPSNSNLKLTGKIVVFQQNDLLQIKRVHKMEFTKDTQILLWMLGDNPAGSTDSRNYGWVNFSQVKGIYLFRYKPIIRLRLKNVPSIK